MFEQDQIVEHEKKVEKLIEEQKRTTRNKAHFNALYSNRYVSLKKQ